MVVVNHLFNQEWKVPYKKGRDSKYNEEIWNSFVENFCNLESQNETLIAPYEKKVESTTKCDLRWANYASVKMPNRTLNSVSKRVE